MSPIRVMLADDHKLVRGGLSALLKGIGGVEVVAEANDGREAIQLCESHQPDIILMDIAMTGMNGLEATSRISKEFPQVRVIILSMHTSEEYVLKALRAGAAGYLLKDASSEEILSAVHRVHAGEAMVSPVMAVKLLEEFAAISGQGSAASIQGPAPAAAQTRSAAAPDGSLSKDELTEREREVLQLVAQGLANKEVAARLGISPHTIKTHLGHALDKLQLHSRTAAAVWATRQGLS